MRKDNNIKNNVISKDRDFKGIWVPRKLYLSGVFSPNEKFVLLEIYSLSKKNECYANNKHFADFVGLKENTIQKMMLEFERAGYIKRIFEYKENSKEIKNRIIILTQKFLDEFINEKVEDENEEPYGKKSMGDMEKNPYGDGLKVGDKYNNISSTYLSNKKDAFTNVNDRMDALKPEGYKGNGIKYISKTDYTEDQLKVYISHTIDTIMLNEYFIADAEDSGGLNLCAELKKIILYFYREYNKTFAEKHPILSDISYGNIADRYMNPSGRKMSEDGVKDFATYKEMIDRYFATDFGRYKGTPENFNYRLSHFMSDNVRENLYAKMI